MITRNNAVLGHFEPEVSRQFLPGCPSCGGAHPLARKGYKGDPDICPDCGVQAAAPGAVRTQKGELGGGFVPFIAGKLLTVGEKLMNFAKRI